MMSAVSEMARILLPRSCDGALAMISAYFDDSGSHDDSRIIVYGGLIGTEDQWNSFLDKWEAKLAGPLPGKVPLSQFHASRCLSRGKGFEDYTRDEAERLVRDLAKIVSDSDLSGTLLYHRKTSVGFH